jgi:hypothetical protein
MRTAMIISSVLLGAVAPHAEPRITREQTIRMILDDYVVHDCAGHLDTHSPLYRRTFERSLAGDTRALHRVFGDPKFHSGDNEAWCSIPGAILYVVGDARFAQFVTSLRPEQRHWALTFIPAAEPFSYPDVRVHWAPETRATTTSPD